MPDDLPPDDAVPLTDAVALQARLDQLEKQASDYKLLVAELQTSMRRLRDDADRQRKFAAEPVVRDLLSAVDNLDWAAKAAEKGGDPAALAKGVANTVSLFHTVLERHGVKRVEVSAGSPFDPAAHEAVMEQPAADVPAGHVVQVASPGFTFHDRLLRPAKVIVAAGG
jgi:molecular chaperone GrpE